MKEKSSKLGVMVSHAGASGAEVSGAGATSVSVSKEDLIEDLRRIGVRPGDDLAVGLSLRSVGIVVGGPNGFIDALLEAVGPEGTILMNTHTPYFFIYQIESSDPNRIFDYRSTPTWTGIVPETLRKRHGAIRSRHPICSVTAMGARANYLTEGHDVSARPYLPYSKLAELGGKVLYVGLKDRMVAMRHEAQYLAGLMDAAPIEVAVRYIDPDNGMTKLFRSGNVKTCVRNLPVLVPALRKKGLVTDGKIGAADSICVDAKDTLGAMVELLREDPTLALCRNVSCVWCRELERRMNLYDRIEDPETFQSNKFIIWILGIINERRLRGSWEILLAKKIIRRPPLHPW